MDCVTGYVARGAEQTPRKALEAHPIADGSADVTATTVGLDPAEQPVSVAAGITRPSGPDVLGRDLQDTYDVRLRPAPTVPVRVDLTVLPELVRLLREGGAEAVRVVVGGVVPRRDYEALREAGVSAVFGPGSRVPEVAAEVLDLISPVPA